METRCGAASSSQSHFRPSRPSDAVHSPSDSSRVEYRLRVSRLRAPGDPSHEPATLLRQRSRPSTCGRNRRPTALRMHAPALFRYPGRRQRFPEQTVDFACTTRHRNCRPRSSVPLPRAAPWVPAPDGVHSILRNGYSPPQQSPPRHHHGSEQKSLLYNNLPSTLHGTSQSRTGRSGPDPTRFRVRPALAGPTRYCSPAPRHRPAG